MGWTGPRRQVGAATLTNCQVASPRAAQTPPPGAPNSPPGSASKGMGAHEHRRPHGRHDPSAEGLRSSVRSSPTPGTPKTSSSSGMHSKLRHTHAGGATRQQKGTEPWYTNKVYLSDPTVSPRSQTRRRQTERLQDATPGSRANRSLAAEVTSAGA